MAAKFKKMRTAGAVPPGYDGPVYWRVMEYNPVVGPSGEPLEFTDSRERRERLWIDQFKTGKDIFTSGTVFDAHGQVLPEWREPIKARWTKPGPVRVEFYPSRYSARVSERVWAAMEALEPGRHHAFPIDIACTDGTIERRYEVFFARDAFVWGGREMHPEANGLKPKANPESLYRYQPPRWLSRAYADEGSFGYLDRSVMDGMHWFKGTDTNQYFSPKLFARLQPLGDIFPRYHVALPVGLAG